MSSKKIIRLKTPQRCFQQKKSPQCSSPTIISQYLSEETVMKIKNHQFQNVHSTLIAQINKIYTQIETLKQKLYLQQSLRQELASQNQLLKSRLQMFQRQCELEKEKYTLQRQNHERLRKFYQEREKQWVCIFIEHRRLLEQYGNRKEPCNLKMQRKSKDQTQSVSLTTSKSTQETLTIKNNFFLSQDAYANNDEKLKENMNKNQKLQGKNNHINSAQAQYQMAIRRLGDQDTKFLQKGQMSQINQIRQNSEGKLISHDQEIEQTFEKVVRLTFLKFKEAGIRLLQIQHSQDMVKLKKAKTSTKERLNKTVKKLNFQFQNQNQMNIFSAHIEKCVIQRYKDFQGCYVFDFLLEKLYECQKMAETSNSFIDKLLRLENSKVSQYQIQKQAPQKSEKAIFDKELSSFSIDLQKRLSLMLESAIKQTSNKKEQQFKKKIEESQINDVACSVSGLRDLSDLIKQSRGDYPIGQYIS